MNSGDMTRVSAEASNHEPRKSDRWRDIAARSADCGWRLGVVVAYNRSGDRPVAIEQLRGIAIEPQMVPIKDEGNIAIEVYRGVVQQGQALAGNEHLVQARKTMFDNLVW
jgi:hypothetical protein